MAIFLTASAAPPSLSYSISPPAMAARFIQAVVTCPRGRNFMWTLKWLVWLRD